jgi:uncharacterized membrane protein (DUF106 family)
MGPFEMVVAIVFLGCVTGIVTTAIDKMSGGKHKKYEQELKLAQERVRLLEAQVIDARRENDMLQKQVEWHSKMLESQDRMMKQLTDGDRPRAERGTGSYSPPPRG